MRAILVSRHRLLPAQEEAIKKAGIEIIEVVQAVPEEKNELQKFIQQLKQKGVEAIVAAALPAPLVAQLQNHFRIFILKMRNIKVTESEEEAKKLEAEAPRKRVALPPVRGNAWRVVEFIGLYETRIHIEERLVVPAE